MSRKSIIFTSIAVFFVVFLSIFLYVNYASKDKNPLEDTPKAKINFVVDDNIFSTIETNGNEELTLPENPTKDGYVFAGWYKDNETFEELFTSSSLLETELTEDMSVYSKWMATFAVNESTITGLTAYAKKNASSIVIPSTIDGVEITAIGNNAFQRCTNLTSVVISDSITSIGNNAFYNCTGLESLVIGSKVETIGVNAIQGCTSLKEIIVASGNEAYRSTDALGKQCNVIIDNKLGAVIQGSLNSTIPTDESVTAIADFAFYNLAEITEIRIGRNIKTIGIDAFANCSGLTSIIIPESVTDISFGAFDGCTSLAEVIIESSEIYESLIDSTNVICGNLIGNALSIKVLTSIVDSDSYVNEYLNDAEFFIKTLYEDYYLYTRV